MANNHILLIEDDEEISRLTSMYLETEGYAVDVVEDGKDALAAIKTLGPDLVILDLMLPNVGGHEICREARKEYSRPILVLTALDDDFNEVGLLKMGADDYLTKPVKPHVLVARIEALLRRSSLNEQNHSSSRVIEMDASTRSIQFSGANIQLTESEFELLGLLYQHKGQAVSREECCQRLKGIDYDICNRAIDMRISGLRKKLNDSVKPYKTIITVRNKGYSLNVD